MTKNVSCPNCGSKIALSETNLSLKRGRFAAEFKNIPAQVCESCGEVYLPGSVAEPLSELAEEAFDKVSKAREKLSV